MLFAKEEGLQKPLPSIAGGLGSRGPWSHRPGAGLHAAGSVLSAGT